MDRTGFLAHVKDILKRDEKVEDLELIVKDLSEGFSCVAKLIGTLNETIDLLKKRIEALENPPGCDHLWGTKDGPLGYLPTIAVCIKCGLEGE